MARDVNITLDFSDMVRHLPGLEAKIDKAKNNGLKKIADEILRLSQREVPHDTGQLQNSGFVDDTTPDLVEIGYNKVYAARLHEHPEYHFQGGRKGKYLEDPIKMNLAVFINFFKDSLRTVIGY